MASVQNFSRSLGLGALFLGGLLEGAPAIANEASPSWLLLYPQHPLYRQAGESANLAPMAPAVPLPPPAAPLVAPTAPLPPPRDGAAASLSQTPQTKPKTTEPRVETQPKATESQTSAIASTAAPLFIPPIPIPEPPERGQKFFPSFTAGSPSAFGASWGDVFAGLSLIDRSSPVGSPTDKADGSIALGFGMGDAAGLAGLEVVYNIISLTPSRFAANGNFDFKLHKSFPDLWAVALGWENAINYGPDAGGTPSSVYGSASKLLVLQPDNLENPMLLGLTLGAGGGRFRPFADQINRVSSVGIFAAAGLQVLPNLSVILDWTGQNLNAGVSYVPFRNVPFYVNATAVDVAGSTDFGTRYSIGFGIGYNFR
ncbi:MAG: hypothetical protein SNJ60_04365 [Pseudanabaenaceae cyanobacterium]